MSNEACSNCGGTGYISKTVTRSVRVQKNGWGCGAYRYQQGPDYKNEKYTTNVTCSSCKGTGEKKGCFITSATMSAFNKDDDCYELTLLRKYRDEYLVEKYPESLQYYYEKSPLIVDFIEKKQEKEIIYRSIKKEIENCIFLIENQEYELAYNVYSDLFETLLSYLDN